MLQNQDFNKACFWCGIPDFVSPLEEHHVFKRGTNPELRENKKNKCLLCPQCHRRTENSHAFLELIQERWITQIKHQDNSLKRYCK